MPMLSWTRHLTTLLCLGTFLAGLSWSSSAMAAPPWQKAYRAQVKAQRAMLELRQAEAPLPNYLYQQQKRALHQEQLCLKRAYRAAASQGILLVPSTSGGYVETARPAASQTATFSSRYSRTVVTANPNARVMPGQQVAAPRIPRVVTGKAVAPPKVAPSQPSRSVPASFSSQPVDAAAHRSTKGPTLAPIPTDMPPEEVKRIQSRQQVASPTAAPPAQQRIEPIPTPSPERN